MKLKSKTFFNRFFSNWHAKVIALIAAIFIFIFYRVSTQWEIPVPLEVKTPAGFEVASDWPETVRIIRHGSKDSDNIGKDNFKAVVDLSSFTEGGRVSGAVQVERLGDAVKLGSLEFEYSPSVIPFVLEPITDKYVPVNITSSVKGIPQHGYYLERATVIPQKVLLRGPKSRVERVTEVTAENVDISGRTGTVSRNVKVVTSGRFVRPIDVREVTIVAVIAQQREKKTFSNLEISFSGLKPELVPTGVMRGVIEIEAPVLFLEDVRNEQLALVADAREVMRPGEYALDVLPPALPEEAVVLHYEPEKFSVRFERKSAD